MTTTPAPTITTHPLSGGATGPFSTGWHYAEPADVVVRLEVEGVLGEPLTPNGGDYTLTGSDPLTGGGTINLSSSLVPVGGWAGDARLIISRRTARRQSLALSDTERHTPKSTERAFDKAMRIAEEDRDRLDMAVMVAPGEPGIAFPSAARRANRFLTFGPDGELMTVVRPDDFDGLNKANRNGDNLTDPEAANFRDVIDPAQGRYRLSSGAYVRAIGDKLDGIVQAVDYYTSGKPWADVFEAAFADVNALNIGGVVHMPTDNLMLTRKVLQPYGRIKLVGGGSGATVIYLQFGDDDAFLFQPLPGQSYLQSSIEMCSIVYPDLTPPIGGAAVVFDGVGECEVRDVTVIGTFRGYEFRGNNRNCRAYRCGESGVVDVGFLINGGGNQFIDLGTTFDAPINPGSRSVRIAATERADLNWFTSSLHGIGVEIKPGVGQLVQNVFILNNDLDASEDVALVVDPANEGSVVRNVFVKGGSVSASANRGVWVKDGPGQVGDIHIDGVMCQSNGLEGMLFEKGDIHVINSVIGRNGWLGGERAGLRFGQHVRSLQVRGNKIGPILGGPDTSPRPMAYENYQAYAVQIDSGFVGVATIENNDGRGNLMGFLKNYSAQVVLPTDCAGFVGHLRGEATIPIGASFVTVNVGDLGLSGPLTSASQVAITGAHTQPDLSKSAGSLTGVWIGSFTETTFDIVTNPQQPVAGQPLKVGWTVRL